eukprot:12938451-Prorocentrum_lima.AAC.1
MGKPGPPGPGAPPPPPPGVRCGVAGATGVKPRLSNPEVGAKSSPHGWRSERSATAAVPLAP